MQELILTLPNGGTLRCGEGEEHAFGGYLRICDPHGNELCYWDVAEWEVDGQGESVIGAVFAMACGSPTVDPPVRTVMTLTESQWRAYAGKTLVIHTSDGRIIDVAESEEAFLSRPLEFFVVPEIGQLSRSTS